MYFKELLEFYNKGLLDTDAQLFVLGRNGELYKGRIIDIHEDTSRNAAFGQNSVKLSNVKSYAIRGNKIETDLKGCVTFYNPEKLRNGFEYFFSAEDLAVRLKIPESEYGKFIAELSF